MSRFFCFKTLNINILTFLFQFVSYTVKAAEINVYRRFGGL